MKVFAVRAEGVGDRLRREVEWVRDAAGLGWAGVRLGWVEVGLGWGGVGWGEVGR